MNLVHFSSKTDNWSTPQDFFDALNAEFHFDLDVCAVPENAKCKNFYYHGKHDGLTAPWHEHGTVAWGNFPYGRGIGKWVQKAYEESQKGLTVVALLPARTDTKYWHRWIWDCEKHAPRTGVEVRFVPGRLKFGGSANAAPFPSAVVVFRGKK